MSDDVDKKKLTVEEIYTRPAARRRALPTTEATVIRVKEDGTVPKDWENAISVRQAQGGISRHDIAASKARMSAIPNVILRPRIGHVLDDAYSVAAAEMKKLAEKTREGTDLETKDIAKFSKLTEAITRLSREERELRKLEDPANMDEAELREFLEEAMEEGVLSESSGKK